MNGANATTREDAQSVINVICWKLKVTPAKLEWQIKGNRAKNGRYEYGSQTIFAGPHTWRGLDCLLHEIAHHVQRMRFGATLRHSYKSHHGREFQIALVLVVKTWYGNLESYSWNTEYKRLASFGASYMI